MQSMIAANLQAFRRQTRRHDVMYDMEVAGQRKRRQIFHSIPR